MPGEEQVIIATADGIKISMRVVTDISVDLLKALLQMIQNEMRKHDNLKNANVRVTDDLAKFFDTVKRNQEYQNYLESFELGKFGVEGFNGNAQFLMIPKEIINEKTGIDSIGDEAFAGREDIKGANSVEGLKYIGRRSFFGCNALRDVGFEEGLKEIGEEAFANTPVKTVRLPDQSLTKIDMAAFKGCSELEEFRLPLSLKEIPEQCFQNCTGLRSMSFSKQVETIRADAFGGCTGLAELYFETGGVRIEKGAFEGCENLKKIHMPKNAHLDLTCIPNFKEVEIVYDEPFKYPPRMDGSPTLAAQEYAKGAGVKHPEILSGRDAADKTQKTIFREADRHRAFDDLPTEKQVYAAVQLGLHEEEARKMSKGNISLWLEKNGSEKSWFENKNMEIGDDR